MLTNHKGGRPPADPRAISAWQAHRSMVQPIEPLALHLGVSKPAISKWTQVPARRLVAVARYLKVSPQALRPDLYPPPPWASLRSNPKEL